MTNQNTLLRHHIMTSDKCKSVNVFLGSEEVDKNFANRRSSGRPWPRGPGACMLNFRIK